MGPAGDGVERTDGEGSVSSATELEARLRGCIFREGSRGEELLLSDLPRWRGYTGHRERRVSKSSAGLDFPRSVCPSETTLAQSAGGSEHQ